VKLSKPIKAHGEEVDEIVLAEPTTKDVRELGYPFMPTADGDVKMYPDVAAKYISRLGKIPLSSVDQLAIPDMFALHAEVITFFGVASPSS
jgi:hypothetical protein